MTWVRSLTWTIRLSEKAFKSLKKMDKPVARRIYKELRALERIEDPRSKGKALTGMLSGLWRYRVGDYRIICDIEDSVMVILAIRIDHRKNIYRSK